MLSLKIKFDYLLEFINKVIKYNYGRRARENNYFQIIIIIFIIIFNLLTPKRLSIR